MVYHQVCSHNMNLDNRFLNRNILKWQVGKNGQCKILVSSMTETPSANALLAV